MRVRFIQTAATDRTCFVTGDVRDLPADAARDFIRAGHAVEADGAGPDAGPPAAAVTAVPPPPPARVAGRGKSR